MEKISIKTKQILDRFVLATKVSTESALAGALGVSSQAIYDAKKRDKIPDAWFRIVAENYGISIDWLMFGNGELKRSINTTSEISHNSENLFSPPASIPVTGLASCGLKDWFNPESIAMRVMLPADIKSTTAIAIIAIGNSMIPLGIRSGNIAICDTSATLEKGDIAYIVKKDGTASIKVFIERDEKWLHVQGWLPPDKIGGQKPYIEKCLLDIVELTAPVIYVRVKA